MPRPGQILPRAPEGSEHGQQAALERLAHAVPAPRQGALQPAPPGIGEANDGFDEVLFAPTERPDEPITAGVDFGPGPPALRRPAETERSYMLRLAEVLERSSLSGELAAYIEAIRAGR